ncbi:long-chain fatty acid transport protein [Blastochloris viridis]|uniref:Long-chain fatty acid transport protein n=1 Tax=Blastochloris viridis TaxID=1079 RepID=A0A182D3T7_BLAVI|nr:long-chain fatty acid transport protein [Blastochloris viridis]
MPAALVLLGGVEQALAAGFQLREQSSEGLGNAFAGSAAKAYNLSTIFYNPAGMTRLQGNQVGGSTTWIAPVAKFSGQATRNGATISGGMGGDGIDDAAVGATYMFWDYAQDLKFGLAFTAPFGLRSNYDHDWVGRYINRKSSITNLNLSPSVAYRINDKLSIGGAVQIGYASATLSQAIDFSGIPAFLGGPRSDGLGTVNGNDWGIGGDIGFLYELSPTTRIGVNWRSQISYKLSGTAKFEVPSGLPAVLAASPSLRFANASAEFTSPDTVAIGLYHELTPQWAFVADVDWTNWSTFKEIRIQYADGRADKVTPMNWHDTWFFSAGLIYKVDDRQSIQIGAAYDQSATDDEDRTAGIPETSRLWLAGGYSYNLGPNQSLSLGYAHLFAEKAPIDQTVVSGTTTYTLTGEYEGHVDIFSASFVMKF